MSDIDTKNQFRLEASKMTSGGEYFFAQLRTPKPNLLPGIYLMKFYLFSTIEKCRKLEEHWYQMNAVAPHTTQLLGTFMIDSRLGFLFPHYTKRMYQVMDDIKASLDIQTQLSHCICIAETVFALHSHKYVHTRLHPKFFYLAPDGKFKLGHLSQVPGVLSERKLKKLKAEERRRLGKLLIYLLTNRPFDALLRLSPEDAIGVLPADFQEDGKYKDFSECITRLLNATDADEGDGDILAIVNLNFSISQKTLPKQLTGQRTHRLVTQRSTCPACRMIYGTSATQSHFMTMACGHQICVKCIWNQISGLSYDETQEIHTETTSNKGLTFPCPMCERELRVREVLKGFPHADLREDLYRMLQIGE